MAPARTRPANIAGRVITAAHAITATIMVAAPAIITADRLTRPTATIPARRTRTGVTARRDITRILVLWGGYPYSGYNNYYWYSTPTYGYNGSMVVAVQRRLGQLGYYHGVVDGVIGPQTRSAIAAFESRNGMAVDGTISRPLLDSLGLA